MTLRWPALTLTFCSTAMLAQAADPKSVQPFFDKNCISCHNEKLKFANLSLASPPQSPEMWEKVLEKLKTGKMPPAGQPAVDKSELAAVTNSIQTIVSSQAPTESGPGRVTARRLNRVEYNNTIRDLLGI